MIKILKTSFASHVQGVRLNHTIFAWKERATLEERGMVALLQPGLTRASLHDYRLGHILDALFAANLNKVFSTVALKALEVYALPTSWLHLDTTTMALYGAYEDEPQTPRAPRPTYGHSKDGRDDLKQVLLSLGVSGEGGIPLRVGVRDGNCSDSVETPLAIEECLALGLAGVRGIVADNKAICSGLQSKWGRTAISAFSGPHYLHLSSTSGPH